MNHKNYFLMYQLDRKGTYSVAIIPSAFKIKIECCPYCDPIIHILDNEGNILITNYIEVIPEHRNLFDGKMSNMADILMCIITKSLKEHLDKCRAGDYEFSEPIDLSDWCDYWSSTFAEECKSLIANIQ